MPPLVVVEGSDRDLQLAGEELAAAGWSLEPGFSAPHRAGRVVRRGLVTSERLAADALTAAMAGQGLVVRVDAPRDVLDRFLGDLRHLGLVEVWSGPVAATPRLEPEDRAILGLLAEGHTLGEAAALLGLSRRTADRRLARGRLALGARRTTEAIVLARRLGWLRRDSSDDRT
jgi:DNA-binding CsgD family transcriptional regulator